MSYQGAEIPPVTEGLFFRQVQALMKKDFQVMLTYRRALLWELTFPLLMGTLACLFLSVFLGQSGYVNSGWAPSGCNGNPFTAYGPSGEMNVAPIANAYGPFQYGWCGNFNNPDGYNSTDAMFEAYDAYCQSVSQYSYRDNMVGSIMYWQNFSQPYTPITVYTVEQLQGSQAVSIGEAVYQLFNPGPPAVKFVKRVSSQPQQFNIRQQFATSGAIMLSFAFLPMTSTMAGRLVDEKKGKVREHLRVMGVTSFAYLLAAFLVAMVRVGFVSTSMLILIGGFNIVDVKCLFGVWFSLVCYGFSLAGFAQIMPAFFSRPMMSNAACSLFISLTAIGAIFASAVHQITPLLAFLFSPSAFVYSAAQLLNNNFPDLYITPAGAIGCLLWQLVMYALISQYLYNINPGEFGVARPLLFPLYDLRDAMFGRKRKASAGGLETTPLMIKEASGASPTQQCRDRIVLENLVKVFGNETEVPAVNKLSLRIREKEIFALLGHNGAGKTTTISMLIGMLSSTSYDVAEVLGYDLNTDLNLIRHHIGICPQFDVLFDDLSARQHLELYAAIKGKRLTDANDLLMKLKLPTDDQKASTFSGGMKRRLSVGNAIVGDSPILFLDEPSSGLDPLSRRQLWELLREEKNAKGKTIVLTTHFMEEADYLGDRIAIMSHGRLYCCDTSANLKSTYGVGYYLNLAKKTTVNPHGHGGGREDDPFNRNLAAEIFNRHVDASSWVHKHESVGDATYLLSPNCLPAFGTLLLDIEQNLDALGCSSYGVAMNTLEDVFVNISEREAAAAALASGKEEEKTADLNTTTTATGVPVEALFAAAVEDDWFRTWSQTWTVYVKKWMSFSRSIRSIFIAIIIPILMVGIGYAAAIPNFASRGGSSDSTWASYYGNQRWPDEANPPTVFIFQKTDSWGPAIDAVLTEFQSLYQQYEWQVRGVAGATMNFQKVTVSEFSVGAFLGDHTISFLQTYHPVLQMAFHDDFNDRYLTETTSPQATITYYYGEKHWSGMYLMIVSQLMDVAVETVWRQANGNGTAVNFPYGVPHLMTPPAWNTTLTPAPTAAPPSTTPSPHGGDSSSSSGSDSAPEFIIIPLAVLVNICIGQMAAGIILPLAEELNKKIYHTLRLHGLSAFAYWLGTFLFDLTTGMVIIVAYIAGCYARGVTQIQNDLLVYQCVVLFLCICSAIMMSYVIVVVLPENLKPSTYIYAASGIYYLTLVIPMIIYVSLLASGQDCPRWIYVMTPSRALLAAIVSSPTPASSVWSTSDALWTWVSIPCWMALWLLILVYKAYVSPRMSAFGGGPSSAPAAMDASATPLIVGGDANSMQYQSVVTGAVVEDPDVVSEGRRVESALSDNMAATLHLRKVYHGVSTAGSSDAGQSALSNMFAATTDKVAVKDLTFGIRSGECFGLLGPNGAGKTTTVKMMMRETAPSAGSVVFPYAPQATDVNSGPLGSMDYAYRYARLGACQQGDTLWETFNAAEHLRLYLRIRLGSRYAAEEFESYIENAIKKVCLEEAQLKHAGKFSGGMKRKLAVAIAMYTGARTVFLDEPSTGMDPYARRALWRSIHEALQNDRCVLLTTHSMEEADAVCARIGIVTNGVMQCVGNSQHLKNRFGSGFSIVTTLHPRNALGEPVCVANAQSDDEATMLQLAIESPQAVECTQRAAQALDSAMIEMFGKRECELKEVLGLQRRYAVTQLPALSFAFRSLEQRKQELGIANYSVSQMTSLEQIFINFAGSATNEGN